MYTVMCPFCVSDTRMVFLVGCNKFVPVNGSIGRSTSNILFCYLSMLKRLLQQLSIYSCIKYINVPFVHFLLCDYQNTLIEDLVEDFRLPINHKPTENVDLDNVEQASLDTKLTASNIGFRLLQKMGWKGKGLGKDEQGMFGIWMFPDIFVCYVM